MVTECGHNWFFVALYGGSVSQHRCSIHYNAIRGKYNRVNVTNKRVRGFHKGVDLRYNRVNVALHRVNIEHNRVIANLMVRYEER